MAGREVAESISNSGAGLKRHYHHTRLQRLILATLDDGGLNLWDLSSATGQPMERVAWALGHLITKGYVVPVRHNRTLTFEKVPGSLFNFILEHEV